MKVLDLFSGIGGFSLGLERAGFTTVQFVEIDPFCQKVLRKHWPEVPIHNDITTFKGKQGMADIICGGFPCQDISQAGFKEGIKIGNRSGLWYEMLRIIVEVRPEYVVIENVAALLVRGFGCVLSGLSEIGYDAEWQCISANEVGAWHKRERVWIVSYPKSKRRNTLDKSKQKRCSDINLEGVKEIWGYGSDLLTSLEWPHDKPVSGIKRNDDGLSKGMDRLRGLGNAIVPQIAELIGRVIMEVNLTGKRFMSLRKGQRRGHGG